MVLAGRRLARRRGVGGAKSGRFVDPRAGGARSEERPADHSRDVEDTYVRTCDKAVKFLEEVGHDACGLNPDIAHLIRLHRPIEPVQEMFDKVLPYARYWHVKNYLRDEDPTPPGGGLPRADGVWPDQLP